MARKLGWGILGALATSALLVTAASGEDAPAEKPQPLPSIRTDFSPGMLPPTPEMWLYEQEMRRSHDTQELILQRAKFRAAQRQLKIASMEWYGLSNSRPIANPAPFTGTYSPRWVGNSWNPSYFRPAPTSVYVVRPAARGY